ncbi:MAG: hypothetical protein ACLPZM_01755 [Thermoplasmata archaeon]
MTSSAPLPQVSTTFVIVVFTVAVVVGALVIYLGVNGYIGGPIP